MGIGRVRRPFPTLALHGLLAASSEVYSLLSPLTLTQPICSPPSAWTPVPLTSFLVPAHLSTFCHPHKSH